MGCWSDIVVLLNILSISFKPQETIMFWLIWNILLTQHSMLHDLFTMEVKGGLKTFASNCSIDTSYPNTATFHFEKAWISILLRIVDAYPDDLISGSFQLHQVSVHASLGTFFEKNEEFTRHRYHLDFSFIIKFSIPLMPIFQPALWPWKHVLWC